VTRKNEDEVRRSKFDVEENGAWQAQRHTPERLVDVDETAIASRRPRRSGKKWRGMARKPAEVYWGYERV